MAAHYLTEVRSLQPAGPYFLGGYCMGVAFEMAQLLHAQGQQVALLAVFDAYALQESKRPCSMPEPGGVAPDDLGKSSPSTLVMYSYSRLKSDALMYGSSSCTIAGGSRAPS